MTTEEVTIKDAGNLKNSCSYQIQQAQTISAELVLAPMQVPLKQMETAHK